MCIIDEAAHVDPALFYKVVLPILQMKKTALLALSSPEGSQNYFSRLINFKDPDTGRPFFRVCNCFMICEDCRKLEQEEQIKCNHVKQPAHWISTAKSARLKMLYETDPATAIKEFGGIIEDDFVACFEKADLERLFTKERYVTHSAPKHIFITVDPSGGGMSQLALCSGYFPDGLTFVVCGPVQYSCTHANLKSITICLAFVGLNGI